MQPPHVLVSLTSIRDQCSELSPSINPDEVDWLSHMWISNIKDNFPIPNVYTTDKQDIRFEWDVCDNYVDLTIDLSTHSGDLFVSHATKVESLHWPNLDMNNKTEWSRIQNLISSFRKSGELLDGIMLACIRTVQKTNSILHEAEIELENIPYFQSAAFKWQKLEYPSALEVMIAVEYIKMHKPYEALLKVGFIDSNIDLKYFENPVNILIDSQ